MSNIQKTTELSLEIQTELAKYECTKDMRIGDIYIDSRGETIIRINKLYKDDYKRVCVMYGRAKNWEATEFTECYGSGSIEEFAHRDNYTKITGTVAEWRQKALDVIEGKTSIESLQDNSTDSLNAENALMARSNKESLLAIQKEMQNKQNQVSLIKQFVTYEMEKRKAELNAVRNKLELVLVDFRKKVKRIMRVITTIEIYLGIEEEIVQIQDGETAPADTPISFRQMVLFMDEEVGIETDGGLDFRDIKVFDEWLQNPKNLHQVLPEQKGIVVFAPRRSKKDYEGFDPQYAAQLNAENLLTTYMLIRNGDCLYRIYTDKVTILPRLFPLRNELADMLKKHAEMEHKWDKEKSEEKIEDDMYGYRKRAVLLQGLIDRTEILKPLAKPVNIFKMDETPELINFIYDDEATLPTGRKPFWDWHKHINKKIEQGSRIVISGNYGQTHYYSGNHRGHNYEDRWYKRTQSWRKVTYDMPQKGVYEVEVKLIEEVKELVHYEVDRYEKEGRLIKKGKQEYRFCEGWEKHSHHPKPPKGVEIKLCSNPEQKNDKDKYIEAYRCTVLEEHLVIYYQPKGEVYDWNEGYRERKNRVAFRIYRDDDFVLNYDQIELSDIDFYLNSRPDRRNYVDMMPILKTLKKNRLVEMASENNFALLVKGVLLKTSKFKLATDTELDKKIQDAISWWKFKNKYKRPIDKDDSKALRMITKHIVQP